ncbi:MAG: hypothetical protein FWD39_01640 [Clostridiales bacterium]|nr:hypothetical protein [Clostridiales bacterium]
MRLSSKSVTLLAEMIIVIFFFGIISTVTLQMFVAAHKKSGQSSAVSAAVLKAQEAAECFKQSGKADKPLPQLLENCREFSGADGVKRYAVYYDGDWQSAGGPSVYTLEISYYESLSAGGVLREGKVIVYQILEGGSKIGILSELELADYLVR